MFFDNQSRPRMPVPSTTGLAETRGLAGASLLLGLVATGLATATWCAWLDVITIEDSFDIAEMGLFVGGLAGLAGIITAIAALWLIRKEQGTAVTFVMSAAGLALAIVGLAEAAISLLLVKALP
jgi:hypothetical protein